MFLNLFYRIEHWWHFLGFILLGFFFINGFNFSLFFYITLAFFLLIFTYTFHDRKKIWLFYFILIFILSIFLTLFQQTIVILILMLSISYNKWFYKNAIGLFTTGFGFPLLFLLPFNFFNFNGFLFYLFLCLITTTGELLHAADHFEKDRKEGRFTMAILLNFKVNSKIRKYFKIFSIFLGVIFLIIFIF